MADSYISATTGEVRGIPAAERMLQVTFDVEAGALSNGTSVPGVRVAEGVRINQICARA
jgi:hypothetical protein